MRKLSDTEFMELFSQVSVYLRANKDWRAGQAVFNRLVFVRPDLAEAIRATPLDPFYRDSILESLFAEILTPEQLSHVPKSLKQGL